MMKKIHEITELLGLYCGAEPLHIISLSGSYLFVVLYALLIACTEISVFEVSY
jgi:hypothetical protein